MTTPLPTCGILLCAGMGTRLSPLTDLVPKPLLRFLDREIAAYALHAFHALGVSRVGLNTHVHHEQFEAFAMRERELIAASGLSPEIRLVHEEALLGTGAGARGVWEALGSREGPALLMNGDVVADLPLERLMKVHRRTGAVATLLTLPPVPGESAVLVNESGHFIAQLPGKEEAWQSSRHSGVGNVTYGGVAIVDSRVFGRLPGGPSCIIREGIGPLLAEGALVASVHHEGFWADLGTPKRFAQATRMVLERPSLLGTVHGLPPADANGVWMPNPRMIHASAVVTGPSWISPEAVVEEGAQVGPWAVIGRGCTVRRRARVVESILSHGATAEETVMRRMLCGTRGVRWG